MQLPPLFFLRHTDHLKNKKNLVDGGGDDRFLYLLMSEEWVLRPGVRPDRIAPFRYFQNRDWTTGGLEMIGGGGRLQNGIDREI